MTKFTLKHAKKYARLFAYNQLAKQGILPKELREPVWEDFLSFFRRMFFNDIRSMSMSIIGKIFYSMVIFSRNYHHQSPMDLYIMHRAMFIKAFQDYYQFERSKSEYMFAYVSYLAIHRGKYRKPIFHSWTSTDTKLVELLEGDLKGYFYSWEILHFAEIEKLMEKVKIQDPFQSPDFICESIMDLAIDLPRSEIVAHIKLE